jgi:hypothetical protein
MKRLLLVLWAALALAGFFCFTNLHAQTPNNSGSSALERPIRSDENQITSWDRQADVQIFLLIAIGVCGAFVTVFQKWDDKWAKGATVALGAATTILTLVNTQAFSADYRSLRLAASEGRALTAQMWALVAIINDPQTSADNRVANQGVFLNKLAQFQTIIDHLQGNNSNSQQQAATSVLLMLPVVHAQTESSPAWTKTLPSDNSSLYFRGIGNDPLLSEAKTKSANDAYNKALQHLKGEAPQASDADILALIKSAAIVQDSAFVPSANGYTYYTLLRLAKEIENIGLKTLPAAPITTFEDRNWKPSDLSFGGSAGLVALDSNGGVSQLISVGPNGTEIHALFRVPGGYQASVVTASQDAVFVGTNSQIGCTVFRYTLADKKVEKKIMGVHQHCAGIATDGNALYLSMPDQKEITRWKTWGDTSPNYWTLPDADQPGPMVFDQIGQRLVVSGSSGKAYGVSVVDGKQQLLNSNLGVITSISISKLHIVFGSGKKILFLARSDNHGENPPANLRLTGGSIVGVAVDSSDNLWFADYDHVLVEGPFSLS